MPAVDFENTKESLSVFIEQFPVLSMYGLKKCIKEDDQFDIDDDALLVYNYLKAYKTGKINSLYIEGSFACTFGNMHRTR